MHVQKDICDYLLKWHHGVKGLCNIHIHIYDMMQDEIGNQNGKG